MKQRAMDTWLRAIVLHLLALATLASPAVVPSFSLKSIQQSTPKSGATNTMTVSLTADFDLAAGSTVTITGLTGSQTADSASLPVTSTDGRLGTSGAWTQSSGELVLTAASGGTVSGTECVVMFELTNPDSAQASPAVSVSAEIQDGSGNSVGSIASAEMTKPGWDLLGVAKGADPLTVVVPSFSLKSIQQSTPKSGATNTMTVSLTADFDLAAGSTVTITGLTGSQTADSASLPVTSTDDRLGTSGAWTQSSGELVLTAASGGTVSGTECVVMFELTNPDSAQSSPAVSVSAEIQDGSGNSVGSIASAEMTKPGWDLLGVAKGADPLTVVVPSFSLKSIQQSTPKSGATNTMTVSLTADFDLAAGSTVTITGLTGSQTADSASLPVTSTDGRLGTSGAWTQSSGELVLTAASGGTVSGTECVVMFELTNPDSAQSSPAVSVSAEIQDGSGNSVDSIASAEMTKPGWDLLGVAKGADPLTVVVPSFSLKSIQQSTPKSGATNTMTVSLTADFDLAAGSTVTITGLTGSQTADSASLTVTSTDDRLGTSGAWTQSSGELVLTAASGGTVSGTECVVMFELTNPDSAQSSPAVSVSAEIQDGSGNSVGSIASAEMTKPGWDLLGVAKGADPLTVVVPSFSLKSIQQSTPKSGATNTMTVSLTADFDLAAGSTVTITGLTGSQTADSASLPVTSTDDRLGTSGAWTQSSGELVLTAASGGTVSGTECVVMFELTNPDSAQASPAVSVSAEIQDGSGISVGSIASAEMTKPGWDLLGVAKGADPLTVVVPSFSLKSIQQSTPKSGATNTMTVSLTADFDLAAGSTVTITGLTGSQTADSASLPVTSTDGRLGTSGAWTQSSGELVLTAASGGTVSGTECVVMFELTNPDSAQASPAVSVSAEIQDGSGNSVDSIASAEMTKPGWDLLGVAKGADPLTVVVPSFSLKSIQQSTPKSGATNTMTVSLTADFDLAAGSTVTITGLTGSQTADSASLPVTSTDGRLGTSGAWTQSSGELVLTAASGGTVSGTECVVMFELTNPDSAQSSPAVSVSAEIQDGSGISVGSIASAEMTKPGWDLLGVAKGADPLTVVVPSFSLKSIQQSTPKSGATNTMTVSLTADFDLAAGSTVTITGLTGSQTADSASLPVTSTDGRLGTSGAWTQSSGELVLTAASGGTVSGTECVVMFELTNPDSAQASPAVSVSAEIQDGSGISVGSIASAEMTKPGWDLLGVAKGADPLTVVVPSFSLKSIQQSTPKSGATNTMTVSLTADFDLAAGSTVTITGLTGSQTADSASLPVTSTDGRLGTSGAWTQSSGELVLTAASGGTVSGTECVVMFELTNPDSAQASPAVSVSAEIQDGSGISVDSIASAEMTKPGWDLLGVAKGADPLTVVVPSFSLKSIQQSTPKSGATNTMTVSLTADFDLAAGSTVTITGLTGSQTADSASLPVTSTDDRLGTSGAWTQSSGELVLTAASGGLSSGTECVVMFELTNPDSAQASPAVSVSAEIQDGSGISVGSIASAEMTKPGWDLLGVAKGADPLTVVVPSFSLKSIQQSTPKSGATNTMTVSLTADFDLAAGSTVTITGLTGSQTADSASLPVTSTDDRLGTSGAWTQSSGELVLTAASGGTVSGTECVVMFELTNPDSAQSSPAVSVSAEIQDGSGNSVGSIASAEMTKPGWDLLGVAKGADPLTVVVPSFSLKSIQQSTPKSGATNTMTVSLTADFDLAAGSTVTITGLTGSQTADSASLPVTSTDGRLGTSGAWTQSSGELVLTAASGGTVSGTECVVMFELTNPDSAQSSPAVSVSAEIQDGSGISVGSIASAEMTKPGWDLLGVAKGADPLTVVVPSFSLKSIQQSTPKSGATNTMTVSLTADFDLAAGSTVTITGLTGSQTADSASLPVTSTDDRLGTSGAWTQSSGELVLTAASGGTVSGTECVVMFELTNPDSAQASPAVSVSAEIQDGSGISVGSIASAEMTKPGWDLLGVAKGADPLTVVVPSFSLKSIQQSTPKSGATNTMTVSLTADFDLAAGSTVTITGLTGSQTADSASLPVTSTDGRLGTSGAWTQSSGELVLTAASGGTVSGTECVVMFELTNPDSAQASPAVSVSAEIQDGSGISVDSIASAEMTKPGWDLLGVAKGADPLTVVVPSFSLKSIQQSTPKSGATNTMTVSLTADFDLAAGSTVTITGLTGSQTADSASLPVTSTDDRLGTSGAWTQSSGELVLTAASGGLSSGTECVVMFELTNPDSAQASPAVSVSAEIQDGSGISVGSIASAEMTKPGWDLLGVAKGADPLTVVVPSFSLKSIQQSTPKSGATNTMTVSLTADFDLAAGSTVTITGLTGSQTADSASLPVTSTDGRLGTSGAWTQSSGELVLTAASGGTVSGTECVVMFELTNPDSAQSSPAVSVSAEIQDGSGISVGSIASAEMTKPGWDLLGVAKGADPLTVVVPSFSLKSIQQSTPKSGATNTMTVSLTADFDLAAGSTVTITGLTGSQTADSASLPVTSTDGRLGTSGAWTQSSGELVLTAASGGMSSGTECVVMFELTNPDSAQSSPAVSVSAEIQDGSGNSVDSIASAEMTKPGWDLLGVAKGADPLTVVVPSFSLKSIQQSTPKSGATNTMTVSLTADFDLAAGSTVTITGLTGSQTADSASLPVTSTDGRLGTSGAWTQSSGELVLTAASGGLSSGTECVVMFELTNPDSAQASPAVSVSAEIQDGSGNSVGSIASAEMTKPGWDLLGVAKGADPLTVVVPSFSLKSIQQSTPKSGATNTMTVSLTADFDLAAGSTVTITGLTGSQTADSASLPVTSTDGRLGTSGAWTQSSGELVLTAASGGLSSGTECVVMFELTNPDSAQASPAVSVSAEIQDGSGISVDSIASAEMTKPGWDLLGVAKGADPLTVVVPSFSLKSIQQSTPKSGATNTMTVSLTADFDLAAGSTVTITGLTGSQTADSASLPVTSTDGRLGTSGAWTQSSGELVLTAASGGTVSGTECVVMFELTNPDSAQASPAVSVSAEIQDGSGISVGSIASAEMTKPGWDLLGVAKGADPLTVVVPSFSLKSIQQSTPKSGATNTMTVSLTADFDLAAGSTVTITGLTGSQTADSASLPVTSTDGRLGTSGAWTQSSGELVLTAASGGLSSGTECVVMFELTNPDSAQASPAVSVSAEIQDGSGNSVGSIASAEMTKPGWDLLGVAKGADPLTVVVPSFSLKSIQQSTPKSGATNTMTVSLTADFDLAAGSTVTITGLTGSQTADSASLPVTSTDGRLGTSGAWTQSSGELVLTAASGGTVSGTECVVMFELTNPDSAQASPAVSVSAEIQDGSGISVDSIASAEMTKPGWDLLGVAKGADPLTVVVPSFSLKSIQQSTPKSGATNTMTVSLTADFDLAAGSTVTITGLTGSQTADSASLPVTSTDGRLGTSGAWTQSSGELVLTAASGGLSSGTECVVMFELTNPDSAQSSPAVSVSAEIQDGSGNSVGSIASAEMTKPGWDLLGWGSGIGSVSGSGSGGGGIKACPANSNSAAGSAECVCDYGYTGSAGECSACSPGKFKATSGSTACAECETGKNNPNTGSSSADACVDCPAGSYSGDGAASCTDCPSDSSSPAGSVGIQACLCNPGYTGPNGGACVACGAGTYSATAGETTGVRITYVGGWSDGGGEGRTMLQYPRVSMSVSGLTSRLLQLIQQMETQSADEGYWAIQDNNEFWYTIGPTKSHERHGSGSTSGITPIVLPEHFWNGAVVENVGVGWTNAAGTYSTGDIVNKARGCGDGSSPCPVSASSRSMETTTLSIRVVSGRRADSGSPSVKHGQLLHYRVQQGQTNGSCWIWSQSTRLLP
jgi:uncharacterized iron-regulated membrane protein